MELLELGDTPDEHLLFAVRTHNLKTAKKAMRDGANVNAFDGMILHWAALQRDDEILRLLLTYKRPPPKKRVSLLDDEPVEEKVWVPPPDPDVELVRAWGTRAIHAAVSSGNVRMKRDEPACVRALVELANADVTVTDEEGMTALHHAAYWGNLRIVQYLVTLPAVSTLDQLRLKAGESEQTPREFADAMGHDAVAEFLGTVEERLVGDKVDGEGESPPALDT